MTNNILADGEVRATNVYVSNTLTAENIIVHYIDIQFFELSGFTIKGEDFSLGIPDIAPITDVLLLSGVGLSATSWATFDGDLQTKRDLYVSGTANITNGFFTNLTAINLSAYDASIYNLTVENGLFTNLTATNLIVENGLFTNLTATNLSAYDASIYNLTATNLNVKNDAFFDGGISAQMINQAPINLAYQGIATGNSSFTEGYQTSATGLYSHAAGVYADAIHDYSYVWNSDHVTSFQSIGDHSFNINASGGVNIVAPLNLSGVLSFDSSTIVTEVTSTGMWLTVNVNGSALAIPLYLY